LWPLDWRVEEGIVAALIGASGSGKSTLARLLTGFIEPSGGCINVHGQGKKKGELFSKVGLVMQNPQQQLFGETVLEEVAFAPKNQGFSAAKAEAIACTSLQDVGLDPEDFLPRSPFTLSGGEKRRVAIAGILAARPRILIMDEPTAGLDEPGRRWIMDLVRRKNQSEGMTVIWITHQMEEAAELAQSVLVLQKGGSAISGSVREVFAEEEQLSALGLDIPVSAKLVRRLKEAGKPLPALAVTAEEAAAEILAWRGGCGP
ncbi:MAG: energy-coupling factor ABC transporter ATP-binding protein, partial [Clostridiales bacterium]|nr:energy-coupling factor ABC transporter ATP-binding protein [Clostridiales bacterium]